MSGGGAERVTALLANAWVGLDHEVTLITIAGLERDAYALSPAIRRVALGLDSDSVGVIDALLRNRRRVTALREAILECRADFVVAMMTGAAVTSLLATRGLGIPVIASERTHPPCLPVGRSWGWLRRLTYPWASRVVMLTEEGLAWLKEEIPAARGVVIPNPVSYPLPAAEPIVAVDEFVAATRKLLLAAGRMDEGKQFDRLLEAYARLAPSHPDWDLVILGEGPERARLQADIARLGLGDRVRMPGRAGNVGDWYARADLYVMSSRYEGFPNTLAEAMAHGCAAVSYDCDTGPRDIIRDGVDGLLVRPVGDVPALADALDRLMGDEATRYAMGCRAIEVQHRYSPERIFGMWLDILERAR
jgi:glycosyltransferase involved in cell wall biosynthesis